MQECNLECTDCGKKFYSASPKYAAELLVCDGCGSGAIGIIEQGEKNEHRSGHDQEDRRARQ